MTWKVYAYDGCDTCRKALKYLTSQKTPYQKIPIVENPPSEAELKKMLGYVGDIRKLFNTSGQVYREMRLSEKLSTMSEAEAIKLLAKNGKLIKRPFVLTGRAGLVGFKESDWKRHIVE